MSATAVGLILDMLGAIVLAFVVPRYNVITWDGGQHVHGRGRLIERWCWVAIIVGFALQLIDVL